MNSKETAKAKLLLKKYFTCKKVYYRTHNQNLYRASEDLLKQATNHLISAANYGDLEAQRILTQLDAKNHIILNTTRKRPWYYYGLWILLLAYLFFFLLFLGNQMLTKSATPNPTYYPYEVSGKKPDVISPDQTDDMTASKQINYPLHEPLLVIRNALYRYVQNTGEFPAQLTDLTKEYPNNYLHTIPLNPISASNDVYNTSNHAGGWYYNPNPNSELPLEKQVIESLKPNSGTVDNTYFSPLAIKISLTDKQLYLVDENYIYYQFPIAVGANNQTPLGTSSVSQKLVHPREDLSADENPYGTRLLELANPDYAIHGTNDNSSIAQAVTNGCIRLTNDEIELLFAMTPLDTPIQIAQTTNDLWKENEPVIPFQSQFSNQMNGLHDYLSNPDNTETPTEIIDLYKNLKQIYQPDESPTKNPDYTPDHTKEWRG